MSDQKVKDALQLMIELIDVMLDGRTDKISDQESSTFDDQDLSMLNDIRTRADALMNQEDDYPCE